MVNKTEKAFSPKARRKNFNNDYFRNYFQERGYRGIRQKKLDFNADHWFSSKSSENMIF